MLLILGGCLTPASPAIWPSTYKVSFRKEIPPHGTFVGLVIEGTVQRDRNKIQVDESRDGKASSRTIIILDYAASKVYQLNPTEHSYLQAPMIDRGFIHPVRNFLLPTDGRWEKEHDEKLADVDAVKYIVEGSEDICQGYDHAKVNTKYFVWIKKSDHLPLMRMDMDTGTVVRISNFLPHYTDPGVFDVPMSYERISNQTDPELVEALQNQICP